MHSDNVICFKKAKFIRDTTKNRYLKVMSVIADPITGEWVTTPEFTKQMTSEVYWKNQENTSDISHEIAKLEDGKEYAILIHWEVKNR